jgi:hypothetical protein
MVPFSCSVEDFKKRIYEIKKLTTSSAKKDSKIDPSCQNNPVLASLALANTKKVALYEPISTYILYTYTSSTSQVLALAATA